MGWLYMRRGIDKMALILSRRFIGRRVAAAFRLPLRLRLRCFAAASEISSHMRARTLARYLMRALICHARPAFRQADQRIGDEHCAAAAHKRTPPFIFGRALMRQLRTTILGVNAALRAMMKRRH